VLESDITLLWKEQCICFYKTATCLDPICLPSGLYITGREFFIIIVIILIPETESTSLRLHYNFINST